MKLTRTFYAGSDVACNPYRKCAYKCVYCNAKQLAEMKNSDPAGLRVAVGTAADPYPPEECENRKMRTVLRELAQADSVGIFTRSPLILRDLDLIDRLDNVMICITVTPISSEHAKLLEPLSPLIEHRMELVNRLVEMGYCVRVAFAPMIPVLSDDVYEGLLRWVESVGVDSYFIDVLQCTDNIDKMSDAMAGDDMWMRALEILRDHRAYEDWKVSRLASWNTTRLRIKPKAKTPIWGDFGGCIWVNMHDLENMI